MPDGSGFDLLGSVQAGAQGQYQPPAAPAAPTAPAAAMPAPAVVPPPSSPAPSTPTPSPTQGFDLLGAVSAGAQGKFSAPVDTSVQNAQAPAAPEPGLGMQFASGLATGATSLPNTIANLPIKGINALFGTKIPQFKTSNPLGIQPATSGLGQDAESAGESIGSLAPMMAGGAALEAGAPAGSSVEAIGKLIKTVPKEAILPVGVGGALQKQVENTPEIPPQYRQLAGMAANFFGAAGASAAMTMGGAIPKSIAGSANAALGIGKKTTYSAGLPEGESIAATSGQAQFAANKVRAAGGQKLVQDLNKDPLQDAHGAISDKLEGRAPLDDGETPATLKQQQAAIQTAMAARGSQFERVPGEQPTTAQVSPSLGMQSLERTARMNPKGNYGAESFQAGDQQRNAAFVAHLEKMNPGITSKLGDAFVERATDLANQQAATEQAGRGAMQQATAPLSANVAPEVTGSQVREGLEAGHTAAKNATTDQFWSHVPQNLTHSTIPTTDLAHVLLGHQPVDIPADAPPELQQLGQKVQQFAIDPQVEESHPIEQKVLDMASQLPAAMPYQQSAKFLSTIAAAKSQLAKAGLASSRPMVRLSMLDQSMQDSMAGDFTHRIVNGEVPLVPSEAAQGQEALNAARQQSASVNQTFKQGAPGKILAQGAYGDYKIHNLADAARVAINNTPSEPQAMGEALHALQGQPEGQQALHDALISDANRRGVIKPDGTVDPSKYARFMTPQRQQTIGQFPGLAEKFQNAATMQNNVDEANGAAVQAVKDYGNGIAKKFIGQDPGVAVRGAINAGDRGQQLMQIHDAVASDPAAVDALKGHVINEVINKFAPEGGAAAGQDNAMIAAKSFRKFVTDYKPGLRRIFGGQGLQNFDFVRAGLQQAQDAKTALGGSQTTPLNLLAKANNLVGGHGGQGLGVGMAGLLGEHASEMVGAHGMIGAGAAMAGTLAISGLKSAAIKNTQDLIGAMMRHPDFAKAMLQRLPPQATMTQALAKRIGDAARATAGTYLTRGLPAPQGQGAKQ